MSKYTIGQVSELLGIKIHTIRYWEKQIPLMSVQRDEAGKRVYGKQDVFILSQLHHLIEKKKYTLKGASDELVKILGTDEKINQKQKYFDVLNQFEHQRERFEKVNALVAEIKDTDLKKYVKQNDKK